MNVFPRPNFQHMELATIIQLYAAFLVVVTLHEFGHLPRKIKFYWHIIPLASATEGLIRWGGLAVNVALAFAVFHYRPENIFFQYVGLIAWVHFILYAIAGSIIPEPKESEVDISTYVFDDVPNEQAAFYIGAAAILLFYMYSYYWPILGGIFA